MAEAPARPPSTSQPDAAARRRIAEDLDATLFVEAGAGSGKTTALVERVVALVVHGGVELASIAAITFTEKAGAELGDRIRRALEERSATSPGPVAERCALALDQLDGAAVGTLHAFAQRLLREHPLEAGLPPRVEVLDEVSSGVEFERRWATFRDALLADPQMERTIVLLLAAGVGHPALRALAAAFDANWDLVAERVPAHGSEPPPVRDLLAQALPALDAVCARRGDCTDATDLLCQRIDEVAAYAERLRGIDDEVELLEALAGTGGVARPRFSAGNVGRKAAWRRDHKGLRAELRAAGEELDAVLGAVTQACAHRLASAIRHFTLGAAEERRAEGRLEFHDLLVMARALLRDPHHGPAVRTRLHHRYRRLLLDELQDTDPIQVELAARIAAVRPGAAETSTCPWDQLEVRPGHLFMVGDPKQSIYRFRRADIAVFLAAQARFGGDGGHVGLTANFRTARPILEWVNHVFAALMGEPPEVDLPVASQPAYVALDPVHPAPGGGPAVALIGRTPHGSKVRADELRQREASEVVASVIRARTEGWSVRTADGGERPVRLGDVAILVPARTSLPFLEDRLDEAGIAYRAESSSLVYATRAVRDCSWCCGRWPTPPTTSASWPPCARPCSPVVTTTSSASRWSGGAAGATWPPSPTRCRSTTRCGQDSPACGRSTSGASGPRPPNCSAASPRIAGPSSWASLRGGPATSGAACASSSTRPGRGVRPPAAACASTCTGWSCRPPRAPGWPNRSCPKPTTTPYES